MVANRFCCLAFPPNTIVAEHVPHTHTQQILRTCTAEARGQLLNLSIHRQPARPFCQADIKTHFNMPGLAVSLTATLLALPLVYNSFCLKQTPLLPPSPQLSPPFSPSASTKPPNFSPPASFFTNATNHAEKPKSTGGGLSSPSDRAHYQLPPSASVPQSNTSNLYPPIYMCKISLQTPVWVVEVFFVVSLLQPHWGTGLINALANFLPDDPMVPILFYFSGKAFLISEDLATLISEMLISSYHIVYCSLFAERQTLETVLAHATFFAGSGVGELIFVRRLPVQAILLGIFYSFSVFVQVE